MREDAMGAVALRATTAADLEVGAMCGFLASLPDRIVSGGMHARSHRTRPSLEIARASLSRVLLIGAVAILGGATIFAAAAALGGIKALPRAPPNLPRTLAPAPGTRKYR